MNHTSAEKQEEALEDSQTAGRIRSLPLPGLAVLIIFLGIVLLFADFSSILFSSQQRQTALQLVKPGIRLTQAERTLNHAGYVTLYIESSSKPAILQVSTLKKLPITVNLIHSFFKNSELDVRLLQSVAARTRFYILSESDGNVSFTSEGKPEVSLQSPDRQIEI